MSSIPEILLWPSSFELVIPNAQFESKAAAFVGVLLFTILLGVFWLQCCAQPKKILRHPSINTLASPENASDGLRSRSSSMQSDNYPFYPDSPERKLIDQNHSFQNLVDLTKPALQHFGASLPVGTLQAAVKNLNDRMRYRFVTSKTHVGGGLSSIFVQEDNNHPTFLDRYIGKTPSLSVGGSELGPFSLDEEVGDAGSEYDDNNSSTTIESVNATEQAFRKSEVFSWLPETIVRFLARRCQLRVLEKGQVLFRAGDQTAPSASTYVIVSGDFSLVIPSEFFVPGMDFTFVNNGSNSPISEYVIKISQGRKIYGIANFIATIVGEPIEYVATGIASSQCVVAEITHQQLENLFDSYEGVREDMIQRSLALLQRVTFTCVYRLTGRYAAWFSSEKPSFSSSVNNTTQDYSSEWAACASKELGVSTSDLLSYARERKRKLSIRRYQATLATNETTTVGTKEKIDSTYLPPSSPSPTPQQEEFPFMFKVKDGEFLELNTPALFIVVSGCLEVRTLNFVGDEVGTVQYRADPGKALGHLALLTRTFAQWYSVPGGENEYPRNVVCAIGDTTIMQISETDYFELVERFPDIVAKKARETIRDLAAIVRLIDIGSYFSLAQPGESLVRQGDIVDGMMVVLHGRVRLYRGEIGGREFSRGAVLGESSYLTNQPSMESIVALRRTSLAWVPKMMVKCVTAKYPDSFAHIGRTISRKMLQNSIGGGEVEANNKKRRAVAIIPVSPNAPTESFVHALQAGIIAQGMKCAILTSGKKDEEKVEFYGNASQSNMFGPTLDEIEILSRMQDAEEANDVVFFQVDPWSLRQDVSKWSKLCIAQADAILLVANATDRPVLCPTERRLKAVVTSARRELVLLHVLGESEAPTFLPRNTREWIEELGDVVYSHHVRFHPYDSRLDTFHWKSDVRRLGRWITGNAVGIVLGGGGARGAAHLSVLKSLEACQIPIDFIGGTSIGAFVGGLYCMKGGNLNEVEAVFDEFAKDMSSLWRKLRDLTFPIVAYLKGYQFNRTIVRVFGDTNIEDFWTNFYCVSTDLTDSREINHRNGFAWKYIRASMTLTGYLPPICDVQILDGKPTVHFLVDGGYIDNLPVDAMRKIVGSSGTVISVDVQSEWKLNGEDYGEDLNGWWYLWRWLSPFHTTPKIPTASDIQSHLAYISCVQNFGRIMKEQTVDLYLAPPIGASTTLDFTQSRKVQEVTYQPVLQTIKTWMNSHKFKAKAFIGSSGSELNEKDKADGNSNTNMGGILSPQYRTEDEKLSLFASPNAIPPIKE